MRLYLKRKGNLINAVAEYDVKTKMFTVLKGSKVSKSVTSCSTFKGARSVEKRWLKTVKDQIVIEDIVFKSASTAANYVTGTSTNGMLAWKTEDNRTLRDQISEVEQNE